MSQAKVIATKPTVIAIESGAYRWYSCGSNDRPFCYAPRKETSFKATANTPSGRSRS